MARRPDDLQRLLAEEPFVRALARSLVADEADDVVQQAYLLALEHGPVGLERPRSWLARIVRNLVADLRRRTARRAARDRAAARDGLVPSSSELLLGEERRRELVAAVDALPEDQRTAVLLRYYDGLPPRRIAAELGVPVATVWNRLHAARQTLRARLDARHGDRRAWLLPLVPFALWPRSLPWREVAEPVGQTSLIGAIAMASQSKIVAACAGLLTVAAVWIAWPRLTAPDARPPGAEARDPATSAHGALAAAPERPLPAGDPAREAAAGSGAARAATGDLVVRVEYADEPKVAAGLTVIVGAPDGDFRVGLWRATTDADGLARFDGLPPGEVRARTTVQPDRGLAATIEAGAASECTLRLGRGMTLCGVVVDPAGVPVAGALVEASLGGISRIDADLIAVTAADGTFTVRQCQRICLVGARAPGHAASQLVHRYGKEGATEHVRLELLANGGAVEGIVVGPSGEPVSGAVVRVGEGQTESILSTPQGAPPLPAQVRTDANGRFLAIGVPAGTQPLQARAAGLAPWRGTCVVAAGATTAARITLSPGLTCTGSVRRDDGEPAEAVDVTVGARGEFALFRTRTGADGTFRLHGLPIECTVAAAKEKLGRASARLAGEPGATVPCELRLSLGQVLRGRLLDDADKPVVSAEVRCEAEGTGARWNGMAVTDKEGRFVVPDCPADRLLTLRTASREHETMQRAGVDPRGGEQTFELARDRRPKARITGRLLRPDGSPAAGEAVDASCSQFPSAHLLHAFAAVQSDGTFALEVPPGEWHARIRASGHPEIRIDPRTLAPGEAWDVGTLQLTSGGTLLVRDGGRKLDYLVLDAREQFVCGLYTPVPPLRSDLLAPGDYVLLVRGDGVAAQALPFAIRAGEETALDVAPPPGVRQRLEFVSPPGREPPRSVAFTVRRDGKALCIDSTGRPAGDRDACAVWLAPGTYSLTTRDREPETSASFTVGATEGPPVRIALR